MKLLKKVKDRMLPNRNVKLSRYTKLRDLDDNVRSELINITSTTDRAKGADDNVIRENLKRMFENGTIESLRNKVDYYPELRGFLTRYCDGFENNKYSTSMTFSAPADSSSNYTLASLMDTKVPATEDAGASLPPKIFEKPVTNVVDSDSGEIELGLREVIIRASTLKSKIAYSVLSGNDRKYFKSEKGARAYAENLTTVATVYEHQQIIDDGGVVHKAHDECIGSYDSFYRDKKNKLGFERIFKTYDDKSARLVSVNNKKG